jgi:hypothetical protein
VPLPISRFGPARLALDAATGASSPDKKDVDALVEHVRPFIVSNPTPRPHSTHEYAHARQLVHCCIYWRPCARLR